MKTTATRPEIRRYLAAVDRAACALPAGRRRELLADLSEHVEVALAERPGELDEILAELGDPQDIAATAVREDAECDDPEERGGNPRTVLALLAASSVLGLLTVAPHGDALHFPVLVLTGLGFVTLALSAWWTTARKWITVAWFILPNLFLRVIDQAFALGHPAQFAMSCISVAVRAGVLVWLWRHRVAPDGPGRIALRLPRWARILLWSLLALFLVFEAFMWFSAFALTDSLSSVKEGTLNP
ncbi:DUF1700 domain-containing protein [Streptomyces sp. NPDC051913]|uniref:DUF1700 domain-containing protein n=1 Tax=Streptomyces sp. NPDC051913 TaxID=3365676 RepID=UPI0037D4D960